MNINIRITNPKDYKTIETITREAFWNLYFPGCDEHYLAHTLREHPDYIADMDFVAEVDGEIVGNIMFTKSYLIAENGSKLEILTFGPFCVLPQFQRQGIGTALIDYVKQVAQERGAKAIVILGDPHNYCRHGFKNSKDYAVSDSTGNFPYGQLMLALEPEFFDGKPYKFQYSSAFELDPKAVEEFDKQFSEKTKSHQPSQDVFSIMLRASLN